MITADVFQAALDSIERGETFALASVVESEGSSPGKPGHKMIVYPDGRLVGTVGGGGLEHQVIEAAQTMIARGSGGLLNYTFDADTAEEGMICGGRATVAVEVISPSARVLLCGGGHVARALARQFEALGFGHVVADARKDIATRESFPAAGDIVHEDPASWIRAQGLAGFTHVIVLTHDHALDQECLRAIWGTTYSGYVGLIGSARKWSKIRAALSEAGVTTEWLDHVHCPIGLPIGGGTPAEIAVSIVAEIIQEKHAGK
jgi:xanthine dehydrogenase accessory factor